MSTPTPDTIPASVLVAPDIAAYFSEYGRLPKLGDPVAPWDYRGWALPYVIEFHRLGGVPDRWGYHLETLYQGKLLDTAIPRMDFQSSHASAQHTATLNSVMKWMDIMERDGGGWSSFTLLIEWLAWALAVSNTKPTVSEKGNEALYRGVNLTPLIEHPSDYFGAILSESKGKGSRWNPTAFFPTPHNVCEMMTVMLMGDGDLRTKSVCDPCVGTGRMLLHASNHSLNLWGMDIDGLVVEITKINGALYAPWMTWPIPHTILGVEPTAPPLPAPLPVPAQHEPPVVNGTRKKAHRVDDHGQGSLF